MYILDFVLCNNDNIIQLFKILKQFLSIIRYVVPIGLTIMTVVAVMKKTINPDDKDGQKRIISRIIAAVLVFFAPVLVRFVIKVVDVGLGHSSESEMNQTCVSAWERA